MYEVSSRAGACETGQAEKMRGQIDAGWPVGAMRVCTLGKAGPMSTLSGRTGEREWIFWCATAQTVNAPV